MFDGQIQSAGPDLFSRHHVSEGIELLADYVRLQKPHGSQKHIGVLLEMLKRYGALGPAAKTSTHLSIHFHVVFSTKNREPRIATD